MDSHPTKNKREGERPTYVEWIRCDTYNGYEAGFGLNTGESSLSTNSEISRYVVLLFRFFMRKFKFIRKSLMQFITRWSPLLNLKL